MCARFIALIAYYREIALLLCFAEKMTIKSRSPDMTAFN